MEKAEFSKLVMVIRSTYPQSQVLATNEAVSVWYELLADLPYPAAAAAIQKWVSSEKWPPTIADIREWATKSVTPEIPEWSAAWETVLAAISRWGMYRQSEALATMDETTRDTVNRMGWQYICWSENINIERATFRDIYNAIKARKEQQLKLPESLRMRISQMQAMAIEDKS